MENQGEQFLHQKDPNLHTTPAVEKAKKRVEAKGEKISQRPADKIEAYLNRFQDILNPPALEKHSRFDRKERNINMLKNSLYKNVIIKPASIPESYYENQKRLAREQGHGDIAITNEMRNQSSEVIVNDQKSTLNNWIDYFTSPDSDSYPMWAKYWTFTNMTKLSTFDKEKHAFAKRDKSTVAPFPDLNREALAYVVDIIAKKANKERISATEDNPELKKLVEGVSFGKLYAYAIEKVTPTEKNELLNTAGKWIKYPQNSDHMPLVKSIEGHGTGWCTAGESTAQAQLQSGDFYVYYSYDKQGQPTTPRVAIRMQGTNIAEVRGIAYEQNLDPYIGEVVDKKLAEFPDGQLYKKKSADMKQLTEIDKRNTSGEKLTIDDFRFLYQLDSKIEGFGHKADPRIQEILAGRDMKSDLSLLTGYPKEQISTTEQEALQGGIKFHFGNLYLTDLKSAEGLKFPETVGGYLNLSNLQFAEGLKLPRTVDGNLYLDNLKSAKGLRLPERVNGFLNLSDLESAEGLGLPEIIGGNLDLYGLKSAEGLKFPETVGGNIDLRNLLSAEGLGLPKTIGGDLLLNDLESARGLKLPETIGGSLLLYNLESTRGLKLPETIGGSLKLNSLRSARGLKLPTIGRDLELDWLLSTRGLKLPETIGGSLNLLSLRSVEKERLKRMYPKLRII